MSSDNTNKAPVASLTFQKSKIRTLSGSEIGAVSGGITGAWPFEYHERNLNEKNINQKKG